MTLQCSEHNPLVSTRMRKGEKPVQHATLSGHSAINTTQLAPLLVRSPSPHTPLHNKRPKCNHSQSLSECESASRTAPRSCNSIRPRCQRETASEPQCTSGEPKHGARRTCAHVIIAIALHRSRSHCASCDTIAKRWGGHRDRMWRVAISTDDDDNETGVFLCVCISSNNRGASRHPHGKHERTNTHMCT